MRLLSTADLAEREPIDDAFHGRDVSSMRRRGGDTSGYAGDVREDSTPEGVAFASLLRAARTDRQLLQDDVIRNTRLSRSTYLRWEAGGAQRPDFKQVRDVCVYLGIDPRRAAISLGLFTSEELDMAEDLRFDPLVIEVGRMLADESIPEQTRAALRHAIDAAVSLWFTAASMAAPVEPSGAELARRRSRRR
jgi:transcriptional regulator with XRE-family HTH domain